MKKKQIRYVSLLCVFLSFIVLFPQRVLGQEEVTFELQVPDVITEGEQFSIAFTVSANASNLKLDRLPEEFEILYGPATSRGSSVFITNGKRSSTNYTTFQYTLLATRAGEYTIPEATVKVGSATYRTAPRRIKVYPTSTQGGSNQGREEASSASPSSLGDDVFIRSQVSRSSIYEQQGVLVTFKIYSKHALSVEDLSLPEFEGFLAQSIDLPQDRQYRVEEYKGKVYRTVELYQVYLFPQRSGRLTIPQGRVDVVVDLPVNKQVASLDDFFEGFFQGSQRVRKSLRIAPLNIEVKPLPSPRPDDFTGAVGNFSLSVETPASVVKADESYSYDLILKGKGNLKLAELPRPRFPEDFETYDPHVEEDLRVSSDGVSGQKKVEYFAVPRSPGDYKIPEVTFSFFDPEVGQYKKVSVPEVSLHVDKGSAKGGAIGDFTNKQDVKYLGKDIRYIKTKGATHPSSITFDRLLVVYGGFFVIALLLFLFLTRWQRRNVDTLSVRKRKAGKYARRWLKMAAQERSSGDDGAYYEALLKGLYEYLSNKLSLSLSALSKERISEELFATGGDEALVENVIATLEELELARYAPVDDLEEKDRLYDKAADLIEKLESRK